MLPGTEVLADDGCRAFLIAVLRHGSKPTQIVGNAHRTDHQIAVNRAHGINNGFPESKQRFLCNNRQRATDHGSGHFLIQRNCFRGKGEGTIPDNAVFDGKYKKGYLGDQ